MQFKYKWTYENLFFGSLTLLVLHMKDTMISQATCCLIKPTTLIN